MKKPWTTKEIEFIKKNIHLHDRQLAELLGRSVYSVYGMRRWHGLPKPKGNAGFKKGHATWNKGKSYQELGIEHNGFKKGHIPWCQKREIGEVYEMEMRKGYGLRKLIRTKECYAYPYQRYVWEQTTGEKLKSSEAIIPKDGNYLNCEFSNLEKLTKNQIMNRNVSRSEIMKKAWEKIRIFNKYGIPHDSKLRPKQ